MIVGIVILAVGLILGLAGFLTHNSAKKILAAPFKKTGEIASNPAVADAKGMISAEGAVKTMQPLTTPCSNQQCVYYELLVEKKVRETKVTDRGAQTTTHWKNVSTQKMGSMFQIDDGSGPVTVHAQDGVDADLKETYKGPPPGGQGLGVLTNLLASALIGGAEQVLEYRATEKIVPLQGNLFVMGKLQGGQIAKTDGMGGKLTLSTRGREGLVGSKKKTAMFLFIGAGVLAAGSVPAMLFIKGTGGPAACPTAFKDSLGDCSGKLTKNEDVYSWDVSQPGKYVVEVRQPSDARVNAWPTIQVFNTATGIPIFNPFNMIPGIGGGSSAASETVLVPIAANYTIHVTLNTGKQVDGGFRYIMSVHPAPGGAGAASGGGSAATAASGGAPAMKSH